ncbi:MAG: winged helix DNA-binding protein [Clostridiales bacterium]|nr:winged helix DNA-binding protein [Clostridiales bacterium]
MNNNILTQFRQLEHLSRRYYGHHNRRGEGGDPNRGQGRILSILKLQPEISQRELGYLLDMRKQSLAELLSKLEAKEYIVRETSEADRRMMQIKLTEKGTEAADELAKQKEVKSDFLSVLTPEEQETLSGYLAKVIEALEAEVASIPDHPQDHHGPHGPHGFESRDAECRGGKHGGPHGPHGPHGPENHGRGGHGSGHGPCGFDGPRGPEGRGRGGHGPCGRDKNAGPKDWERRSRSDCNVCKPSDF